VSNGQWGFGGCNLWNILIIDDQGLILSDNMSVSNELSSPLSTCVIKNIEMIRWKDEKAAIISTTRKDEDECSVVNSSCVPSQDETDVTSFEDYSSLETQQTCGTETACEENHHDCVNG
jgi:hypothetical protein